MSLWYVLATEDDPDPRYFPIDNYSLHRRYEITLAQWERLGRRWNGHVDAHADFLRSAELRDYKAALEQEMDIAKLKEVEEIESTVLSSTRQVIFKDDDEDEDEHNDDAEIEEDSDGDFADVERIETRGRKPKKSTASPKPLPQVGIPASAKLPSTSTY